MAPAKRRLRRRPVAPPRRTRRTARRSRARHPTVASRRAGPDRIASAATTPNVSDGLGWTNAPARAMAAGHRPAIEPALEGHGVADPELAGEGSPAVRSPAVRSPPTRRRCSVGRPAGARADGPQQDVDPLVLAQRADPQQFVRVTAGRVGRARRRRRRPGSGAPRSQSAGDPEQRRPGARRPAG